MKMTSRDAATSSRAHSSKSRRLAVALATLPMATALTLAVTDAPASASATGCTGFGQHTIAGHTFPSGYMCGHIEGSGTYVDYIGGNFQVAGSICNYRFVGTFYNNSGQFVRSVATSTYNSCTWDVENPIDAAVYSTVPAGRVVIALQSAGSTVASITEYIH